MHPKNRSLASGLCVRCGFALLAALLVPALAAAAQAMPDYSSYTVARFIPFENAAGNIPPLHDPPKLRFSIQGRGFEATIDTGTTGVMLSARALRNYKPVLACNDPESYPGWEFLSSSKLLWVGHWVREEIEFRDADGVAVIAAVPVLAVECEAYCPGYDELHPAPECPGHSLAPAKPAIRYMGVGFGREFDGQPQGTPDKNPLLNIVKIDGKPVQPKTMRSGYIITPKGVHVGLTSKITPGFVYTGLSCPQQRDCSQAPICVSVDGSACAPGSVLVDTGIPQMYLTVPPGIPVKSDLAPDRSDPKRQVPVLQNGSRVTVQFGAPDAMACYSFVVGQMSPVQPMQPVQVILPPARTPAFVNTGRHFLRNFDVLFDADGGFFGLRWTGPPGSTQGGLSPGT